jgi:hypothetical protein
MGGEEINCASQPGGEMSHTNQHGGDMPSMEQTLTSLLATDRPCVEMGQTSLGQINLHSVEMGQASLHAVDRHDGGIGCTSLHAAELHGGDIGHSGLEDVVPNCTSLPVMMGQPSLPALSCSPALAADGISGLLISNGPRINEDNLQKLEDNMKNIDEEISEDNPPNVKKIRDGMSGTAVKCRDTAAWTPIRVRKEKLGIERNLGISPKSLKIEKLKIGKSKPKLNSGKVLEMKLVFEGASPIKTKATSCNNPYVTNLTAAQDKLSGELYCSGQLYCGEGRDWTGRQDQGTDSQLEEGDSHPGQGGGGGWGTSLGRDEGAAILDIVSYQQLKRKETLKTFLL